MSMGNRFWRRTVRASKAATRWAGQRYTGVKATAKRLLTEGPWSLLTKIFPTTTTEPPAIGTQSLIEGYDTMPWLRACGDKASTAVACTDWRLYATRRRAGKAHRDRVLQRAVGPAREKVLDARRRAGQL